MVCVVASGGKPLMPTSEYRARKLLSKGRAEIYKREPFTIRLLDREDGETQPVEYRCDTGDERVGVSIRTEKRELVSEERALPSGEPEKRPDRVRRRKRKRYGKPRPANRKGATRDDGREPSAQDRVDAPVKLFLKYQEVMPITEVTLEMKEPDAQVRKAAEESGAGPAGT